jgi:hypothetical protein
LKLIKKKYLSDKGGMMEKKARNKRIMVALPETKLALAKSMFKECGYKRVDDLIAEALDEKLTKMVKEESIVDEIDERLKRDTDTFEPVHHYGTYPSE